MITIDEWSKELGVSRTTVYKWIAESGLEYNERDIISILRVHKFIILNKLKKDS